MRRPAIVVAVVVAVVVAIGLIIVLATLNVNKYRPTIESQLSKKLNRPVTLGQLGIRLLPFSIRVTDFTIGEPAGFPSNLSFAKAADVSASAGLFSVITGHPDVKSLTLDHPQIELFRNAQGVWNFSDLGASNQGNAGGSSANESGLRLDTLKIIDGQVGITDELKKTSRAVYNRIDADVSDFAPDGQFGLDLKMHFPGQGQELLALTGKAGPLQTNAMAIPFRGHLSLQQIGLTGLKPLAGSAVPDNTDAVISGDADVVSESQSVTCKGNMKFDNTVVQGAKLAYPVELQYDLGLDIQQDLLKIHSSSVKIGPTALSLSGSVNQKAEPPAVDLRLVTNNASLIEVSHLASAFGVAFNQGDQIKGTISADVVAKSQLKALQVNGTLAASTLQAQEFVLSNLRANCNMSGGVVQLSPVTADAYGGKVDGTVTLDTKPLHPLCSAKVKLAGVDSNSLLSAVSSVKNTLYGSLAADTNLNFAVDASSNLARTLNGTLDFNLTNGQLKNVNILSELSRIGKFVGHAPAQSASGTALKKFTGTFQITNGTAVTNNLVGVLDEGSLSANGSLDLANERIDMHLTAVLNSGTSQGVGGSGIGGFLNTALANKNGELVLPVLVTGTAEHPVIAPDVQALAKMKLNNLLPTSGDPTKLTSGLIGSVVGNKGAGGVLGGILGGAANQPNSKQQNQQQNPVNSILNQLEKKKK